MGAANRLLYAASDGKGQTSAAFDVISVYCILQDLLLKFMSISTVRKQYADMRK